MAKLISKKMLITMIKNIASKGWHKSVKRTIDTRNDGAVGNTLEVLLGIKENNLPIPNAREWELKGQRSHTSSLITLKHVEPSPTAARIVSSILIPKYGWPHKLAGTKYSSSEKSFRSTTSAICFTNRGFIINVNRNQKKVKFVFDATKAHTAKPKIRAWLKTVRKRVGVGPLNPEPYWGFEDLKYTIGEKIKNCFYVIADTKKVRGHEFFLYKKLYILSGYSFKNFLHCIKSGSILVDFDARSGHNHGTKFRLKQGAWIQLYKDLKKIKL